MLKSLYPSAQVFKLAEILVFLGLNQTNCTKANLQYVCRQEMIIFTIPLSTSAVLYLYMDYLWDLGLFLPTYRWT